MVRKKWISTTILVEPKCYKIRWFNPILRPHLSSCKASLLSSVATPAEWQNNWNFHSIKMPPASVSLFGGSVPLYGFQSIINFKKVIIIIANRRLIINSGIKIFDFRIFHFLQILLLLFTLKLGTFILSIF